MHLHFASDPFPTGVAAAPDLLLVSRYCADEIDEVDCNGNVSFFASIPGFGSCRENTWLSLHCSPRRPGSYSYSNVYSYSNRNVYSNSNSDVYANTNTNANAQAGS